MMSIKPVVFGVLALLSSSSAFAPVSPKCVQPFRHSTGLARTTRSEFNQVVLNAFDPSNGPKKRLQEEEPDEFFMSRQEKMSTSERFKDPLLIIGLASIFFPFICLVVAYGAGWIGQ